MWRNWLCALIGVWFIIHEWAFRGTPDQTATLWASIIVGIIQVVVSIWATRENEPSWQTWQNWISTACGFYFIIEPFTEDYYETTYWAIVAPAIITIGLNFWTMMIGRRSAQIGTRL